MKFILILIVFFSATLVAEEKTDSLSPEQGQQIASPEIFQPGFFSLLLPPGMRYRKIPGIYLHMQSGSEASPVWPVLDPVLEPLFMGLTMVQEEAGKNLKDLVDSHSRLYVEDPKLTMVEDPVVNDVRLLDGTRAKFINQRFLDTDYRGIHVKWVGKLLVTGPSGKVWILTTYIKCSQAGWRALAYERLPWFLFSHLKSLVFDEKFADQSQRELQKVYRSFNWNFKESIRLAAKGKRFAKMKKRGKAKDLFRESLQLSEFQVFSLYSLANILFEEGRELDRAHQWAQRSYVLTQGFSNESVVTFAKIERKKGGWRQAVDLLDHALPLQPQHEKSLKALRKMWVGSAH